MLLVVLGFSYKPMTISAAPLAALDASYMLPDGSFASLCLPDHGGKSDTSLDRRCEVCRLVSSVDLPQPSADAEPVLGDVTPLVHVFVSISLDRLNFPPNAPPRGPPAVAVV
ncbi:hypothetical protein [Rhizobium sp.]